MFVSYLEIVDEKCVCFSPKSNMCVCVFNELVSPIAFSGYYFQVPLGNGLSTIVKTNTLL